MPTLGEVAQFNAGTFAPLGRLGESFNTGVNIARGLQDIDIKRNEFARQQEAEVNQILNATYQHPDWVSNDPHKMLGVLQDAKKIAQARNLPIAQGGALDQIEEGLFNAQSPQDLQRVNELFKSNLIRGGYGAGVTPKVSQIGGVDYQVTETPIGGGGPQYQPLIKQAPTASNQSNVPSGHQAHVTNTTAGVPSRTMQSYFKYPVRGAEPFVPLPGEEAAQKTGIARREALEKGALNLPNQRNELEIAKRQIKEIKDAKFNQGGIQYPETGLLGSIKRNIYSFFGSDEYIGLEKSLERVAVETAQALGANTNDARDSVKTAMGGNARSLDVIEKVIDQELGKLKHVELKNKARQLFAGGDRNYEAFERVWQDNADPKIFEAMYLSEQMDNPKQQEELFIKMFGAPGSKTFNEAARKYQNIIKLTTTGSL